MNFTSVIIVVVAAIVVVGLFMLGMSLTYLIKGHHVESEISTNPNMKKMGIKCAAQQMREQDRAMRGENLCSTIHDCSPNGCNSCVASILEQGEE